jgi:ribosomal protein S18 acetylase RimI-like enzyme
MEIRGDSGGSIEPARVGLDLDGATAIVMSAFDGDANARLGWRYARAFLESFAADGTRSLLVAHRDGRVAGFAAGEPSGRGAERYRRLRPAAARALLARPWLLLDPAILRMLGARWHGAAPAGEDAWFLALFGVAPADRGRGIGTALLAAFEREGMSRGFNRATLLVRETNGAARALYERCGWSLGGAAPTRRVRYGRQLALG